MQTWVFNQDMLNAALEAWLDRQVSGAGASLAGVQEEFKAATRRQIEDFLGSPEAAKAKMFIRAQEKSRAGG